MVPGMCRQAVTLMDVVLCCCGTLRCCVPQGPQGQGAGGAHAWAHDLQCSVVVRCGPLDHIRFHHQVPVSTSYPCPGFQHPTTCCGQDECILTLGTVAFTLGTPAFVVVAYACVPLSVRPYDFSCAATGSARHSSEPRLAPATDTIPCTNGRALNHGP